MRLAGFLLLLLMLALAAGFAMWPAGDPLEELGLEPGHSSQTVGTKGELQPRAMSASSEATQAGAASSAQRSAAFSFTGHAEDWLASEVVVGARLDFRTRDGHASAVSASDGHFDVRLEPALVEDVEVGAPEGYWTFAHGFEERSPEPHYLARFAPLTHGPFHARLVDSITREPLPEYVVRVQGEDDWSETLRTDAEGILRTQVLYTKGKLTLYTTEEEFGEEQGGHFLARTDFAPAGAHPSLATIAIDSGPTYRLIIDKPAELKLGSLRTYLVDAEWVDDLQREHDFGQELRAGSPTWVRFNENYSWVEDGHLVLLGPGGRWRGVVQVDTEPGLHADPVHVRVESMARLLGVVLSATGEGVARADVELNAVGGEADSDRGGVSRWALSNGRGNFAFEGLPPGPYTLSIRHQTQGALTTPVDLAVNSRDRREFKLDPFSVGGDIEGTVRSRSGEFHGPTTVFLTPIESGDEPAPPPRTQRLRWAREGAEHVARFKFIGVADAKYRIRILARGAPFLTTPARLELTPPSSNADFEIDDENAVYYLSFNPLDDSTGGWLRDVHLNVSGATGEELYSGPTGGWRRASARPFAEDEKLSWELRKPGYVTARGDRSAFKGFKGSTWQFATVRLRRN